MLNICYQPNKAQRGSTLLEALVSIFIFSIAVLGLVGLQATSIKSSIDAKYRADAALLANQIIGQMWVDRASIDSYAHYAGTSVCNFTGAASAKSEVTNWVAEIGRVLPAATLSANKIAQISIATPITNTRQVTVTICWQSPQETSPHNFVATAHINL